MNNKLSLSLFKWQSTYKRNGKSMVQHEVQADGKVVIYEREIKGDEMHVVCLFFS